MRIEKAMPFQALIKDYKSDRIYRIFRIFFAFPEERGYFLPFLKKGKSLTSSCRPISLPSASMKVQAWGSALQGD
jgi:hypothetical protein